MAPLRFESSNALQARAATWLDLPAQARTPELMKRALVHADRAVYLMGLPSSQTLRVQAEARYRNGQFAGAVEAINEIRKISQESNSSDQEPLFRAEAILAMAEARQGRQPEAEAALGNARRLGAESNPGSSSTHPLLVEAEAVVREAREREAK